MVEDIATNPRCGGSAFRRKQLDCDSKSHRPGAFVPRRYDGGQLMAIEEEISEYCAQPASYVSDVIDT